MADFRTILSNPLGHILCVALCCGWCVFVVSCFLSFVVVVRGGVCNVEVGKCNEDFRSQPEEMGDLQAWTADDELRLSHAAKSSELPMTCPH